MSDNSKVSNDFVKIIKEFVGDIKTSFPEYESIINSWWKIEDDEDNTIEKLHKHCLTVFPERLMDILYQNNEIFNEDSTVNTEFLPGISFKYLWKYDISDKTRETIWKYLQMIVISIIGNIQDKSVLGDTSKIFDSINEDDFKDKLKDTLENIQNIFNTPNGDNSEDSEQTQMPNADELQGHMQGLLGGKLGQLAQEIAQETTEGLDIDLDNVNNVGDVFQTLFKNPGKLMGLVKDVGEKLDGRMKSGEINQSELLTEAGEMMSKMKNMPGMENIQDMMGKMGMNIPGMPNMSKSDIKRNMNAMESNLKQNMKSNTLRDRLKQKAMQNSVQNSINQQQQVQEKIEGPPALTDDELMELFADSNVEMKGNNNKDNKKGDTSSKKKKKKVKKA